jgi:hypothetical protein
MEKKHVHEQRLQLVQFKWNHHKNVENNVISLCHAMDIHHEGCIFANKLHYQVWFCTLEDRNPICLRYDQHLLNILVEQTIISTKMLTMSVVRLYDFPFLIILFKIKNNNCFQSLTMNPWTLIHDWQFNDVTSSHDKPTNILFA